jgi:hypothetical protein
MRRYLQWCCIDKEKRAWLPVLPESESVAMRNDVQFAQQFPDYQGTVQDHVDEFLQL